MTENSFPFGGAAEPQTFDDSAESGSRKPALLVGGLVASLLLGAGGFFLLSGGGEDDAVVLPVRKPQAAAPAEGEPAHVEVIPVATTEQVGRSPFKVLYVAPKAASAGTTTSGAPTGTGTGATSGTSGGGETGATGGGTSFAGSGGSTGGTSGGTGGTVAAQPKTPPKYLSVLVVDPQANQVSFKLVDRAAAKPEDVEQTVVVKPGEVFATYFKLLGYGTVMDAFNNQRNCTDLQYGDARIKLCEGESYQVG